MLNLCVLAASIYFSLSFRKWILEGIRECQKYLWCSEDHLDWLETGCMFSALLSGGCGAILFRLEHSLYSEIAYSVIVGAEVFQCVMLFLKIVVLKRHAKRKWDDAIR